MQHCATVYRVLDEFGTDLAERVMLPLMMSVLSHWSRPSTWQPLAHIAGAGSRTSTVDPQGTARWVEIVRMFLDAGAEVDAVVKADRFNPNPKLDSPIVNLGPSQTVACITGLYCLTGVPHQTCSSAIVHHQIKQPQGSFGNRCTPFHHQ